MAELSLTIDASLIALAYKAGLEAGFILANETNNLESELNINQIITEDE